MEWWGSEQSPGSLRQLHEKTSWEGQKHLDRCIGGDKWAGGRPLRSLAYGNFCSSLSGSRLPSLAFSSHLGSTSLPSPSP